MNLSAASNTEISAYELLKKLGYYVERLHPNEPKELWVAISSEHRFSATGLVELLGLVKLAECKGENWQVSDEQLDLFLLRFG